MTITPVNLFTMIILLPLISYNIIIFSLLLIITIWFKPTKNLLYLANPLKILLLLSVMT